MHFYSHDDRSKSPLKIHSLVLLRCPNAKSLRVYDILQVFARTAKFPPSPLLLRAPETGTAGGHNMARIQRTVQPAKSRFPLLLPGWSIVRVKQHHSKARKTRAQPSPPPKWMESAPQGVCVHGNGLYEYPYLWLFAQAIKLIAEKKLPPTLFSRNCSFILTLWLLRCRHIPVFFVYTLPTQL